MFVLIVTSVTRIWTSLTVQFITILHSFTPMRCQCYDSQVSYVADKAVEADRNLVLSFRLCFWHWNWRYF